MFAQSMEKAFKMDETTWQHHANPWSVWTRYTVLPLLLMAIWSRIWLGWWSLGPLVIALWWMWLNPRLFSKPESTDNWSSKAVMGERVWLNRHQIPIPAHHYHASLYLSALATVGFFTAMVGALQQHLWIVGLGSLLFYSGKLWCLDQMVWLFEDMKEQSPRYQQWLY